MAAAERPGRAVPDQRKSFRIPVSGPAREAVLTVGQTEVPVGLLDESAGGFAVLADQRPDVEPGDIARLTRNSDRFEVRVAHVTEQASDATEGGAAEPQFRLGLERLRELDPAEGPAQEAGWLSRLSPQGRLAMGGSFTVVGIGLGTVIVAALIAAAVLTSGTEHSLVDGFAGVEGSHAISWESPLGASAETASRSSARSSAQTRPAAGSGESWSTTIRRLPGATAFLLKEVVEYLALSESQQEQIRQIAETTAERMQRSAEDLQGANRRKRSELRTRLLDKARQQVLDLLTDEQRDRWNALQRGDSP